MRPALLLLSVAILSVGLVLLINHATKINDDGGKGLEALQIQIDALKRQLHQQPQQQWVALEQEQRRTMDDAGTTSFTHAADFGAVGDSATDDTAALQAAIDSAADNLSGGTVVLGAGTFITTAPLDLKGGVTLQGQGYGSSPLAIQFDAGGSTIAYCGTDYAVKVTGHSVSIRDVAIYDWPYNMPGGGSCDQTQAAGGVLMEANSRGLESVSMDKVLLYFFMGGTALTLRGINEGGIAYASFRDLRVRHAKQGIHLQADSTSFVNSNQFFGGAISGGITDVAVLAEGPGACNDNKFYGMVIEPPVTSITHVHVKGSITNVRMHDVRLEGTGMVAVKRPLVIIEDDSYSNVMTGLLGHTHVQADLLRNPGIDFVSAKTVGIDPPPYNQFRNAAFLGLRDNVLPNWNVPANGALSIVEGEELFSGHQVLRVDYLNFGGNFVLSPTSLPLSPIHSQCSFGVYARSSVEGAIVATMRFESGSLISSTAHSGSGEWEFIAMSALFQANNPNPAFYITNDVDITAPTFVYGSIPASPGASLMSASGAAMDGTFAMSMTTATPPASGTFWTLPQKEGNVFKMNMQGDPLRTIARINDQGAVRFAKGTVITLLFAQAGTRVSHSAYIKLSNNQDFVSTPNSSLTLVSTGGPTWTEVSRNS